MTEEAFVFIDVVKNVLLRRMSREVSVILTDSFLELERVAKAVTLYERVGDNFVTYIKSLYAIRSPKFLFLMAGSAVEIFQNNLDICWAMTYNPEFRTKDMISWLPVDEF